MAEKKISWRKTTKAHPIRKMRTSPPQVLTREEQSASSWQPDCLQSSCLGACDYSCVYTLRSDKPLLRGNAPARCHSRAWLALRALCNRARHFVRLIRLLVQRDPDMIALTDVFLFWSVRAVRLERICPFGSIASSSSPGKWILGSSGILVYGRKQTKLYRYRIGS